MWPRGRRDVYGEGGADLSIPDLEWVKLWVAECDSESDCVLSSIALEQHSRYHCRHHIGWDGVFDLEVGGDRVYLHVR